MAITFVGKSSQSAIGTGALDVWIPDEAVLVNDLLLIFLNHANQPVAAPSGWQLVPNTQQGTGTAAAVGATGIQVFWKLAGAAEGDAAVAAPGNYGVATMMAFRGVDPTNPFDGSAGNTQAATTAVSYSGLLTTTTSDALVVFASGTDRDANNTANFSGYTSNAGTMTERFDETVSDGVGGGLVVWTGIKSVAGAVTGTATQAASAAVANVTIGLRSLAPPGRQKRYVQWL